MPVAEPTRWPLLTSQPRLDSDQAHVWCVPVGLPDSGDRALLETLSPTERERAGRFRFDRDRHRFIVVHSALRRLLSIYTGEPPDRLHFETNAYGKPRVSGVRNTIRFNVSDSGRLALIAVARDMEVGVDIEHLRADVDVEDIAAGFFSPEEVVELMAVPAEKRVQAFFNCWTRKEAYIKAMGMGLSHPLDGFDVSLTPGAPAVLRRSRHDPDAVNRWSLLHLDPCEGYVAALVIENRPFSLSTWTLPPSTEAGS